jgi:pyrroline-5-carboxylate reductase
MINVGFLGAGNMGFAIIKGLYKSMAEASDVKISLFAYDPDGEKTKRLEEFGVKICSSEKELAQKCKYLFLAVKPQSFGNVLEKIADNLNDDTVLISIAAGITGEFIKLKTKPFVKVVLVMPNTPLLIGEGATALAKIEPTSDEEFEFVTNIFSLCGEIAELPKDKMKEIIAVNSSSPAFIYLFAKGFIDYAESAGIDSVAATTLFSKALIGSAKMITDSGYSIDELIKMVSSPGGTTLAGLDKLYEGNLTGTVVKACESCTSRAYELGL